MEKLILSGFSVTLAVYGTNIEKSQSCASRRLCVYRRFAFVCLISRVWYTKLEPSGSYALCISKFHTSEEERQMTRLALLLMGLLCGALSQLAGQTALAGVITVSGPSNIVWNGGPSPRITLMIENLPGPSEDVVGFQLDLNLVPVLNQSTGVLRFNTINVADADYIFDGTSAFFDPVPPPLPVMSDTVEDFFDFGFQTVDSQPFGLVTFDLDDTHATPPSGYFEIVLSAYDPLASWYFPDGAGESPFDNTEEGAQPAVLGVIGINVEQAPAAVPESSTLQLSGVAVAMLLGAGAYRYRRRTNSTIAGAR